MRKGGAKRPVRSARNAYVRKRFVDLNHRGTEAQSFQRGDEIFCQKYLIVFFLCVSRVAVMNPSLASGRAWGRQGSLRPLRAGDRRPLTALRPIRARRQIDEGPAFCGSQGVRALVAPLRVSDGLGGRPEA